MSRRPSARLPIDPSKLDFDSTIRRISEDRRIPVQTLYRWIREGRIHAVRFGPRTLRVSTAEIDALIQPVPARGDQR